MRIISLLVSFHLIGDIILHFILYVILYIAIYWTFPRNKIKINLSCFLSHIILRYDKITFCSLKHSHHDFVWHEGYTGLRKRDECERQVPRESTKTPPYWSQMHFWPLMLVNPPGWLRQLIWQSWASREFTVLVHSGWACPSLVHFAASRRGH